MGRQVFTAGEILTAASMNDLGDQTVMVFDDATDRATAIPTPVEGMVTYLKDLDRLEQFDGTDFVVAAPPQTGVLQVVRATDSTNRVTTSQSFVDAGLTVTITPSAASSKIFLLYSGQTLHALANFADAGSIAITDSSDNILLGAEGFFGDLSANASNTVTRAVVQALDSPATTSAVTFKIRFKTDRSTLTLNNTLSAGQFLAMEVAG